MPACAARICAVPRHRADAAWIDLPGLVSVRPGAEGAVVTVADDRASASWGARSAVERLSGWSVENGGGAGRCAMTPLRLALLRADDHHHRYLESLLAARFDLALVVVEPEGVQDRRPAPPRPLPGLGLPPLPPLPAHPHR